MNEIKLQEGEDQTPSGEETPAAPQGTEETGKEEDKSDDEGSEDGEEGDSDDDSGSKTE